MLEVIYFELIDLKLPIFSKVFFHGFHWVSRLKNSTKKVVTSHYDLGGITLTKEKESKSSIKTQLLNPDRKYLQFTCIMVVGGITSLLLHGLILLSVPDLGHSTADQHTRFLNSLMGLLGFGGMFTLCMSVPFVVRTFKKDKGHL